MRVVTADGATKEVVVEAVGLLSWVVVPEGLRGIGFPRLDVRLTPRDAVAAVWRDVVEIREPGEATTAEQVAEAVQREREAQGTPTLPEALGAFFAAQARVLELLGAATFDEGRFVDSRGMPWCTDTNHEELHVLNGSNEWCMVLGDDFRQLLDHGEVTLAESRDNHPRGHTFYVLDTARRVPYPKDGL